eukprot:s2731_g10.t1
MEPQPEMVFEENATTSLQERVLIDRLFDLYEILLEVQKTVDALVSDDCDEDDHSILEDTVQIYIKEQDEDEEHPEVKKEKETDMDQDVFRNMKLFDVDANEPEPDACSRTQTVCIVAENLEEQSKETGQALHTSESEGESSETREMVENKSKKKTQKQKKKQSKNKQEKKNKKQTKDTKKKKKQDKKDKEKKKKQDKKDEIEDPEKVAGKAMKKRNVAAGESDAWDRDPDQAKLFEWCCEVEKKKNPTLTLGQFLQLTVDMLVEKERDKEQEEKDKDKDKDRNKDQDQEKENYPWRTNPPPLPMPPPDRADDSTLGWTGAADDPPSHRASWAEQSEGAATADPPLAVGPTPTQDNPQQSPPQQQQEQEEQQEHPKQQDEPRQQEQQGDGVWHDFSKERTDAWRN